MKRHHLFFAAIFFSLSTVAKAQPALSFFPPKDLVTSGIYYYPEQWDERQWERDIARIAQLGFEFVHLAEFAWFKMEPVEGLFDFVWLDKAIQLCEQYHLKVVLCTPSATTPAWMRDKYPETFVMNGQYFRTEHGTRGLGSIVNTRYKAFVSRIVTKMAQHYGNNKNIIGWQLDNEPDAKPDYSPSSQIAFRQWLKRKYKTIDALNKDWGTAFWSQWYNSFDQVIIPNTTMVGWWGNNPHALLDFRRYLADAQAEFLDAQAALLRKHISPEQFITTNYTAISTGADPSKTKKLDFATYTAYPNAGADNIGELGFRLGNSRLLLFAAEFYRGITGVTGVMEIQPGPVNWGSYNPLLLPGTVRMWLYHSFAAGGRLACSYRFRQVNYSAEQYHSGIIESDGTTLSQGGKDYEQFMKEIKELRTKYKPGSVMPEKLNARSTAILWNLENYWTIDRQKQTYQWDAWNYPIKFLEIAKSIGAPVDIISEKTDLSSYKFVIVPAYEMVDTALVGKWTKYVNDGGRLIITCRTGTKDKRGHFWANGMASSIEDLIGARIQATDMLSANKKGEVLMGSNHYNWNNWADLLSPNINTQVLATYSDQFYKGTAAIITRKLGKGTITYLGVDTDDGLLEKDLLRDIYQNAGVAVENYPKGVYVYWRDGFYFAVNYSSEIFTVNLPGNAEILIGGKMLQPAGVLVWKE